MFIGIPVVLLGFALVCGWQLLHVASGVLKSQDQATALRASLEARDLPRAHEDAVQLRGTADDLRDRTDGLVWSLMGWTPGVGGDLRAIRTASSGLASVARGAEKVLGVGVAPDGLLRGDRVSLSAVREISTATSGMVAGFGELDRAVDDLSSSPFGPIRSRAARVADSVTAGHDAVRGAAPVLEAAPALLGEQGTRNYLLVFQNNAEIRATGGLMGSAAWLTVTDGRLRLERTFSPIEETNEVEVPFSFTPAERVLYGDNLAQGAIFVNSMPDFSRVADLLRQGWGSWFAEPLDGVISLDAVSLSYLLDATGPVEVMGQTLTGDNAVDELLSGAYSRYPDNEQQDAFFSTVADTTFDAMTSGRVDGPVLVSALRRMDQESRLALHFFADNLSVANLDPFTPAPDEAGHAIAVGLNNVSGDKMSYYLRSKVAVTANGCKRGRESLTGAVQLTSRAPLDATSLPARVTEVRPETPAIGGVFRQVPLGSQMVQLVLRAPQGGSIGAVDVDGATVSGARVAQGGLETVSVEVQLGAQQSRQVSWQMSTGKAQAGDVDVIVTPSIEPTVASFRVPSACG